MLTVLAGRGVVSGGDDEREVSDGEVVVYEPNELHGMRALDEELVLLATIAPRPGARAAEAVTRSAAGVRPQSETRSDGLVLEGIPKAGR
jgi:mannose-6-phosphate isomerase-like protein (cupin superfamily)